MCVRDIEIKLVDRGGRTVLSFVKRAFCDDGVWTSDDWGVAVKPRSKKMLMHDRPQQTQTPERYLTYLHDEDRYVLKLPGLTLRWENVTPVLDDLAENLAWVPRGIHSEHAYGTRTLTVDQLREHIGS
jgi:hypothetical protein